MRGFEIKKCSELPVVLAVVLVGFVQEQVRNAIDIVGGERLGNLGFGRLHDLVRWALFPGEEGEPLVFHEAIVKHVTTEIADMIVVIVGVEDWEAGEIGAVAHGGLACPVLVGAIAVIEGAFATLIRHHHPVETSEVGIESSFGLWL